MVEHRPITVAMLAMVVTASCGGGNATHGSDAEVDIDPEALDDSEIEPGMDADAEADVVTDSDAVTDASTDDGSGADAGGCGEVMARVQAYRAAHPGNGGMDWDVNALSPAEVAADPDARQLLDLCGEDQRPVFPLLAWEYGGVAHQWIAPELSALLYCVYIPVDPSSSNWQYDPLLDRVTADVYVWCPEQNPCNDREGANQVSDCIGNASNFEILVDTASWHDGIEAGLSLAEASTELKLILEDGTKVHLYTGL